MSNRRSFLKSTAAGAAATGALAAPMIAPTGALAADKADADRAAFAGGSAAADAGMAEMSEKFREKGSEVYLPAAE